MRPLDGDPEGASASRAVAGCPLAWVGLGPAVGSANSWRLESGSRLEHRIAKAAGVFKPNHALVPLRPDGGIDMERVTAITIIDVVDYH